MVQAEEDGVVPTYWLPVKESPTSRSSFGAEFNAELERRGELDAGLDAADQQSQLPPRTEPKRTTP